MTEFAVPSLSDLPQPPRPEALIGAASPLWAYYVGAAAGGVAWWWMTRWTQPENLEALFGAAGVGPGQIEEAASFAPSTEAAGEPFIAAAKLVSEEAEVATAGAAVGLSAAAEAGRTVANDVAEAVDEAPQDLAAVVADAAPPAEPIGGEAAPISPVAASAEAPVGDVQAQAEASAALTADTSPPSPAREPRSRVRSTPASPAGPSSEV